MDKSLQRSYPRWLTSVLLGIVVFVLLGIISAKVYGANFSHTFLGESILMAQVVVSVLLALMEGIDIGYRLGHKRGSNNSNWYSS